MIIDEIEDAIGPLGPTEQEELNILLRGGVTIDDVNHALLTYFRAYRITGHWGYLRAVMLNRAAERAVMLNEARS